MASSGAHTELVLAGLLFSVAVLVTAARVLAVPYPIFLVLRGLAIAWIPGIPHRELPAYRPPGPPRRPPRDRRHGVARPLRPRRDRLPHRPRRRHRDRGPHR